MTHKRRKIAWFSCGAASAVATKLARSDVIAYCQTGAEHSDNKRFMADCAAWFGQVATQAGYAPDGGGFNNALGRLRTLELISGHGELRASENLFG